MNRAERTWNGDWKNKVLSRIKETAGCRTATEFIAIYPTEPYLELVKRLGDDVAAIQLESLHFSEAQNDRMIREAAMDSLVRELHTYLKEGWRLGAKDAFETSGAYADWITRLQQKQADLKHKADLVWSALEEVQPPTGWLPIDPHDQIVRAAFDKGWPV